MLRFANWLFSDKKVGGTGPSKPYLDKFIASYKNHRQKYGLAIIADEVANLRDFFSDQELDLATINYDINWILQQLELLSIQYGLEYQFSKVQDIWEEVKKQKQDSNQLKQRAEKLVGYGSFYDIGDFLKIIQEALRLIQKYNDINPGPIDDSLLNAIPPQDKETQNDRFDEYIEILSIELEDRPEQTRINDILKELKYSIFGICQRAIIMLGLEDGRKKIQSYLDTLMWYKKQYNLPDTHIQDISNVCVLYIQNNEGEAVDKVLSQFQTTESGYEIISRDIDYIGDKLNLYYKYKGQDPVEPEFPEPRRGQNVHQLMLKAYKDVIERVNPGRNRKLAEIKDQLLQDIDDTEKLNNILLRNQAEIEKCTKALVIGDKESPENALQKIVNLISNSKSKPVAENQREDDTDDMFMVESSSETERREALEYMKREEEARQKAIKERERQQRERQEREEAARQKALEKQQLEEAARQKALEKQQREAIRRQQAEEEARRQRERDEAIRRKIREKQQLEEAARKKALEALQLQPPKQDLLDDALAQITFFQECVKDDDMGGAVECIQELIKTVGQFPTPWSDQTKNKMSNCVFQLLESIQSLQKLPANINDDISNLIQNMYEDMETTQTMIYDIKRKIYQSIVDREVITIVTAFLDFLEAVNPYIPRY